MSISLYDLLDVDEGATADQIRTAWKAAIADLDPTDRRFRAFNDAAGVLLDEEKRAAYDAELAADRSGDEETAGTVEEPPVAQPESRSEAARGKDEGETTEVTAARVGSGPPTWSLAVAAAAAVLALALAIVVLTWPGSVGGESPADRQESADQVEEDARDAVAAAATAIPEILSYDYRTIDADFAEAAKYLTDEFAAKRTALFEQKADSGRTLRDEAVATKTVVTAAVAATGLTRVSEGGDRATVVVYLNQDSQKGKTAARPLLMWATLSMVSIDGDLAHRRPLRSDRLLLTASRDAWEVALRPRATPRHA